MELDHRRVGCAVAAYLVAHLDEDERAGAALLAVDVVDRRGADELVTDAHRRAELERLPAHMRRGSGTGGRKPPRLGWPSGPMSHCRCIGRKYSQCHSGGSGVPAGTSAPGWSSVAVSAPTGAAVTVSRSDSLRPIQW